jgi:hypothetical protein
MASTGIKIALSVVESTTTFMKVKVFEHFLLGMC